MSLPGGNRIVVSVANAVAVAVVVAVAIAVTAVVVVVAVAVAIVVVVVVVVCTALPPAFVARGPPRCAVARSGFSVQQVVYDVFVNSWQN